MASMNNRRSLRVAVLGVALGLMLGPVAVEAQEAAVPRTPAPQAPSGDDKTPYSEIELVSSVASVQPGTPFMLAVHITVDPGWHTYWINGGDAGEPLLMDWSLPAGFEAGPLQWPVPHLVPAPPLMSYGYTGQVFVLVEITPPADAAPGTDVEIGGAADFQVCADICLIALDDIGVTLPVRSAAPLPDENWAATIADTESRIALPADGWAVRAWTAPPESDAAYIVEITSTGSGTAPVPASLPAPHLFADSAFIIEHAAPQRVARMGDRIRIEIERNYFATESESRLGGLLVADVESENPIAWEIEAIVEAVPNDVLAEAIDPLASADVQTTGGVPEGMAPLGRPPEAATFADPTEGLGLLAALLFALLGGVLLNLMPCVFPVLSLKVLGLIEKGGEAPARARRHGLAFGAGVVVFLWVLAGVLMALRAGGERLGWGFQLQSPVIVGLLALLLFGLALNMSGLFEMGLSLTRLGGFGGGGRYRDSFVMGGLTVLVATPCTAPFMGVALGFALVQPPIVGLAVFTSLAVGLAAPYVLLTSMPAMLRRLPRPGPWMETARQALAFPLYGTVVWLLWVLGNQAGVEATTLLLVGMMSLALAGWIYGRFGGPMSPKSRAAGAAALVVALVGVAVALRGARGAEPVSPSTSRSMEIDWEPFSPQRLVTLRTEGRPIFIDFTADWCLSCKVNERIALGTESVRAAFDQANVAPLVADWTNRDPVIAETLEAYGRSGVPLYVVYGAEPGAEPEILPAVLTPGIVVEAVERAAGSRARGRR